jgi:hypothetical protein
MRRADLVTNQTVVARGSVTQANMKISAVDGTAFIDFTAANVLTTKIGHLLKIYDSSKKCIQGFAKAAGSGETLDVDLVVNGDFSSDTGWTLQDGYSIGGGVLTRVSGTGSYAYKTIAAAGVIGALYRGQFDIIFRTSGSIQGMAAGSPVLFTSAVSSPATYSGYSTFNGGCANPGFYTISQFAGVVDNFSFTQVLTPSTTGVTITSTKGGATYNWAAKQTGFNYSDASGYTYEIVKVASLIPVAGFGGTVTASQQHVSTVDGTAFFFSDALDFTPYQDGRHYLRLKDAAGVVAWAKIKSGAPGGESLGDELIAPLNFSASWIPTGCVVTNATTITANSGTQYIYKNNIVVAFALHKMSVNVSVQQGTFVVSNAVSLIYTNNTNMVNEYRTAGAQRYIAFNNLSTANTKTMVVNSVSIRQVTVPPATGVILNNSAAAANFIEVQTGFNPNNITNVQVLYQGDI